MSEANEKRIAEHGDFVELRDGTQLGPVRIDAEAMKWPIFVGGGDHKMSWIPSGNFINGDVETALDIVKVIPRPSLTVQPPDDEPTACGLHPSGYAIEKIIEHHSRNVAGAIAMLLHVHSGNWDDLRNIEEAARLLGREMKRIDVLQNGGGLCERDRFCSAVRWFERFSKGARRRRGE